MRLVDPTDFRILETFSDGKRNNAVNVAKIIEADRPYVNSRLTTLADYGLLKRVGPAEHSGIYEITEKGQFVLEHQDEYSSADIDFLEFVHEQYYS